MGFNADLIAVRQFFTIYLGTVQVWIWIDRLDKMGFIVK
ncbi:MAG: hypothetical protein RIR31_1513 [Bacteroidota bacterium]|jgi:hypothetical protein